MEAGLPSVVWKAFPAEIMSKPTALAAEDSQDVHLRRANLQAPTTQLADEGSKAVHGFR